ncbi:transaldolase [Natronospirillum operosum]|uniref:Transaldolase n=1 Tax=Natronospirillum operosum TaxID=2759953 RepID=A0A4Z0W3E6_9GAMM|nr:transaldolase [Natronospirillum operosum]TGG91292.1 transaldolase [Natronospirillum operosum]
MMNCLQQLRQYTTVVADTGDFDAIKTYQPEDATTNPSLLLKAAQQASYQHLVQAAVAAARAEQNTPEQRLEAAMDHLSIAFGRELTQVVPGYVSTEVDARLSFDRQATVDKAHRLMALYEAAGVGRERILIKVASTWEGIQAARELEQAGIRCNLTLLFSLPQAIACAEAGVTLISPFVGRILDWYQKTNDRTYSATEDPGVQSVQAIYRYYKTHGYDTIVMGASFRNEGEIEQLAGCDRLTISPALLESLQQRDNTLTRVLAPEQTSDLPRLSLNEAEFRWAMNEDAMATEKLAEGIRTFHRDAEALRDLLRPMLG